MYFLSVINICKESLTLSKKKKKVHGNNWLPQTEENTFI